MCSYGCRSCVSYSRSCYHTVGHIFRARKNFRNIFYFWIVQWIRSAVFINAHSVNNRFITCVISGCTICGVSNDRVIAGSSDESHVWHFFHSQYVVEFTVAHAFGKDTSYFFGLHAHAVANEEDNIFSFLLSFFINDFVVICLFDSALCCISYYVNAFVAGIFERYIVDAIGNVISVLSNCSVLFENFASVFTVNCYSYFFGSEW